jgi:hypothetical protein
VKTASLGEVSGTGCVKRIWVTGTSLPADPHELCKTALRMYWIWQQSGATRYPPATRPQAGGRRPEALRSSVLAGV